MKYYHYVLLEVFLLYRDSRRVVLLVGMFCMCVCVTAKML